MVKIQDIVVPRKEHALDIDLKDVLYFREWDETLAKELRWHLENKGDDFFEESPKVWKQGSTYICLDGRMRMLVYREKYDHDMKIPVTVIDANIKTARAHISLDNAKPGKPYTKVEKDQAIWEIMLEDYDEVTGKLNSGTKTEPYKHKERFFQSVFGISRSTIKRKRSQMRDLVDAGKQVPRRYEYVKWGLEAEKEGMSLKDWSYHMNATIKQLEETRKRINNPLNSRANVARGYLAMIGEEEAKELVAEVYGFDVETVKINMPKKYKDLKHYIENGNMAIVESDSLAGILNDPLAKLFSDAD